MDSSKKLGNVYSSHYIEVNFIKVKNEKRQELLEKLQSYSEDDIVIHGRLKNISKDNGIERADFRGSRYRGVSKNKGKWQVRSYQNSTFISMNEFYIRSI